MTSSSSPSIITTYSGSGRVVIKDLAEADVKLDYFQDTAGSYAGFDRFGRIIDHRWRDYGTPQEVDRFKHGYDRNSNRLYRDHANTSTRDGLYSYDGLNRLTDYDRGDLNGTLDGIASLSFAQEWSLKALGNWTSFREDADGNGTFSDSADLTQTRSHNKANEITDISGEQVGQVAWATPGYDAMGNVTSYPKPSAMSSSYTCKYDAWNRLTEVKEGANLVGAYSYDGLGRRITKKTYDSGGSLTETRQFFYSNRWQIIEERVDGRSNPQERQYVWGMQYVDELILRDRDANGGSSGDGTLEQRHYGLQDPNYSVTCIVDSSGDAAERYVYTPYGSREIRSSDFSSSLSSSAVGWDIGHQGLMHDTNTSLVYNRHRMLHPGLGRFMQRDPLGYVRTMNLYLYVSARPVTAIDPSGLEPSFGRDPIKPGPGPFAPAPVQYDPWPTQTGPRTDVVNKCPAKEPKRCPNQPGRFPAGPIDNHYPFHDEDGNHWAEDPMDWLFHTGDCYRRQDGDPKTAGGYQCCYDANGDLILGEGTYDDVHPIPGNPAITIGHVVVDVIGSWIGADTPVITEKLPSPTTPKSCGCEKPVR
ncbi:RHS repeat domain-containing protein [Fontivita pretiosa]|uniref:RHS repeat domain-containing protein n=1 Tax=Fontivita pretiosa TaxID=2989684 RepID=UPI003D17352A